MKLYFRAGTCALAPHIVAREAGVDIDLVAVDRDRKTADGRDYLAINPNGYVPALDIGDGPALTETSVLVQYLADRKPESGLMPAAGDPARYRAQQWLAFIATELHKGFAPLFIPGTPDEAKELARKHLANRLAFLDQRLGDGPFLMGDAFTAADAYAFTVLGWGRHVGIDIGAYPNLARYHAAILERPAVQRALKEQGLI